MSKLKDRAFRMAERRIKDCVKMQQKHHQRLERKFLKESIASDNSDAMSFSSYNSSSTLSRKLPQFNTVTSNMPYSQVRGQKHFFPATSLSISHECISYYFDSQWQFE